ncbi:ABC transporter substrate-binding protein [Polaromonas sp. SM01]|uniref:ABC transporter substrate-binding protein n=1 Tax=Polaromonas sp. SM01 TaxID=3085630 RepID=UPI002980D0E7|nr:ABC transporter substrate-binding protein [Polaromonas sp. SM01]MDW5442038.1 ABC transporter substrate-binding protein [Polaromonas sp. SM01]
MAFRLSSAWLAALALTATFTALPARGADIVLGQVGPFTVIPVPDAPEINQGIKAYVNEANKQGLRGRKISFFELDDRYSADGFAEQFGKAMEKKPLALLSPIGSNALKRMLDDKLLDKADVVVMNAIPGAESFRSPGHPKLFHIRAGDKQQIEKMVNHSRTIGMTRLSVLYQDLSIGTSGMAVAQETAGRTGSLEIKGVKSGPDAAALAAASQQIATLGGQGVLVLGAPRFMADGVAALRKAGVSQSLFVLSYVPAALIVKLAGVEGARGVGIAQTFPNPNGRTLPVHRDFQAAMKATYPQLTEYTSFHLEGYLSARTVAEAVKRNTEKEPTATGLAKTLRSMGELDFGGFRVDFSKSNVGSNFVDIGVIGSDGRLRY